MTNIQYNDIMVTAWGSIIYYSNNIAVKHKHFDDNVVMIFIAGKPGIYLEKKIIG